MCFPLSLAVPCRDTTPSDEDPEMVGLGHERTVGLVGFESAHEPEIIIYRSVFTRGTFQFFN